MSLLVKFTSWKSSSVPQTVTFESPRPLQSNISSLLVQWQGQPWLPHVVCAMLMSRKPIESNMNDEITERYILISSFLSLNKESTILLLFWRSYAMLRWFSALNGLRRVEISFTVWLLISMTWLVGKVSLFFFFDFHVALLLLHCEPTFLVQP